MIQVAALYVETGGCYFGLPDVDPWDKARDARSYPGPHPVVAHPPCERWGKYWHGSPSRPHQFKRGDDGGCFAAALAAVRKWGGVLEHPEGSSAWFAFGLVKPPKSGGWIAADWVDGHRGWTCSVEQGGYGHAARKPTWLYACHVAAPPDLRWGVQPGSFLPIEDGFKTREARAAARTAGWKQDLQRLSHKARRATPHEFRDMLLSIARSARPVSEAAA